MKFEILKCEPKDITHVLSMIQEFAESIDLSKYCTVSESDLLAAMFGNDAFVQGLIAFADKTPIGYAIFFPYFSSFKGQRGLHLEDIYIKPEFRCFGIGEKMLREIAKIAANQQASRIDFHVMKSNEKAIKFYEKLGAVCNEDDTHFKFDNEAFQKLTF